MDRRDLIKTALAGSGMAILPAVGFGGQPAGDAPPRVNGMPYGILGRTGVKVSRLGIGCAQIGNNNELGNDDVGKILRRALELGVNYFDTAPNYSRSEEKMGHTVKEIRDKIFLVTKNEEPTYEGAWKSLRRSLERLQTDHIDLVHIHNFGFEERFSDLDVVLSDKGILGALREAKKQGAIRFIGASGHLFPSRFHRVLDTGEIDVVMNAVNFVARHVYNFEDKVWSRARLENVGLVAMKVLGGGMEGFRLPESSYEEAIRYAVSIPGLTTAVIGLQSIAEVERAAKTIAAAKPFTEQESAEIYRKGLELAQTDRWRRPFGEPVT